MANILKSFFNATTVGLNTELLQIKGYSWIKLNCRYVYDIYCGSVGRDSTVFNVSADSCTD